MIAGLPGTGIGGLFYVGLTLLMPFRELYRAIRGRSNAKRWSFIAVQMSFVLGIAGGMWGEAWAIGKLVEWIAAISKGYWHDTMMQARMLSYVIPGGAVLCLVAVVLFFYALKFTTRLGEKSRKVTPAPVAVQRETA